MSEERAEVIDLMAALKASLAQHPEEATTMRGKRAVQEEIPGTESPARDPELHALALELKSLQDERIQLTKDEKEKREEIALELNKRNLTEYFVDGVELWLEATSKVKVRVGSEGEGDD